MSMNNHLWNEVDVTNDFWNDFDLMHYCVNQIRELRKEEPVNEVAIKRYSEDMTTIREYWETQNILASPSISGRSDVGCPQWPVLRLEPRSSQGQMRSKIFDEQDLLARNPNTQKDARSAIETEGVEWPRLLQAFNNGLISETSQDEDGLSRSKFFDERANERASQFPVLRSEPHSSILTSPPISERSDVGSTPIPDNDTSDPKKDDAQTSCTTSADNAVPAEIGTLYPAQTSISESVIDTDFPVDVLIGSPTETEGVERPRLLPAFDNGLLSDEDGQSRQFPVLSSEPRSSQGQLRSKILSPPISERSDVGPPPLTDNDMIDRKKDDTQMAECLNELKSGKTFRNPTSCHTSVDNAVPVEIGTLSLAQTSISETVIDTDFPVDVLIGNPFRLAQLEGTTERDRQVPEKIDDTFYKDARSSMRKDIVIVADGGIGGNVSTSTVPSCHTTQAQQIEFLVEPGHPKCWMQSKDSWKSSMPQYTGLQSASQASQYERPHQAESLSHSILQFRPEGFILPNPAKNPNRFPFERKLLAEYTRRMFAAQQLEPSISPVASRSHAIEKPVSFKQQDACIDRGKAPFKLDWALQIIGRHLWCRLLQQWTICQALPCTPDETFPPGRYNYLTTSKSFKATRDQGPSSSSKLLCYWGIELAI